MVLQTDACISLDRMHILMYFQTQYQQIEIRKLSKTKQADALMETAVSITENQEISLIVEVEDSPVLLDLPDFKETIKIGPYSRSAFSLYAYNSKQQFPWTPGLLIYSVMIANENYYGLIRIEPKIYPTPNFLSCINIWKKNCKELRETIQAKGSNGTSLPFRIYGKRIRKWSTGSFPAPNN